MAQWHNSLEYLRILAGFSQIKKNTLSYLKPPIGIFAAKKFWIKIGSSVLFRAKHQVDDNNKDDWGRTYSHFKDGYKNAQEAIHFVDANAGEVSLMAQGANFFANGLYALWRWFRACAVLSILDVVHDILLKRRPYSFLTAWLTRRKMGESKTINVGK